MPLTDEQRAELRRVLSANKPATTSRFAPNQPARLNVAPVQPTTSRFGSVKKKAGTALSWAFDGRKLAAALLPKVSEEDIKNLPAPLEFAVENLLSPVGLASLALAPVTGGASIAGRVGLGAALASKPLAVRGGIDLAGRIASDLAISGVGNLAAKGTSKALEDADPRLRTLASLGAGLAAGGLSGAGLSKAVRPSIATKGTVASVAQFRADKTLPQAPNIAQLAGSMSGKMPDFDLETGKYARDFMATKSAGPKRLFDKLVDPSAAIRTQIGKAGVSARQATDRGNEFAVLDWQAAKYPLLTNTIKVNDKGAFIGADGVEVPWREALKDSSKATELQRTQLSEVKEGLELSISKYNSFVKEESKLSLDDLWVPNAKRDGTIIPSGNPKFKEIEANAISKNFKVRDVERPDTMLYLYAKSALDKDVEDQLNSIIKPFYAAADNAFVKSPEGARLKANLDESIKALESYKLRPKFTPQAGTASKAGIGDFGGTGRTARALPDDAKANRLRSEVESLSKQVRAFEKAKVPVSKLEPLQAKLRAAEDELKDFRARSETVEVRRKSSFTAPTPKGTRSATSVRAVQREADDATLTSLREAQADAEKAWEAYKSSGKTPFVGKFKGEYIYDREHGVEELNSWVTRLRGGEPIPGLDDAQNVADAARFFSASMDGSAPFINLLPTMFSNPGAWAKAMVKQWKTIVFDPDTQIKFLSEPENYRVAQTMARNNLGVADIENLTSGARGGLAHNLLNPTSRAGKAVAAAPKAAYGRFQRGYETALTVARIEVWKSLERLGWEERRIADWIRESTGAIDSGLMGITPAQRTLESIALFSPRMFRSTIALLNDAIARPHTPEGALAAQTVLRMMGSGVGLFAVANAAVGELAGESQEQIVKRMEATMDPTNGRQFLAVQVGDQWYGIGGTVRAVSQAIMRSVANDDEKAARDGNPVWDFFSGRLSPAARSIQQGGEALGFGNWDAYNQIENPMDWATASAVGLLPFWAQDVASEGSWPTLATGADALTELAGVSVKDRSSSDVLNAEAFRRHQMSWAELTDKEQDLIKADHPDLENLSKDLQTKEDVMFKSAITNSNTQATEELIGVNSSKLPASEKRDRIQEVLRDRWVRNKGTYETFVDASEIGPANTDKRAVTDAYFKLFEEAGIGPANSGQVDWDVFEELNADLDLRIKAGEFGDPARAQQYLDERRKFNLPEELSWYTEANEVVKANEYWEQKDVAFAELFNLISKQFPDIDSARELENQVAIAKSEGNLQRYTSLNVFKKLMDKRTTAKRKTLKLTNPELKEALTALGR